MRKKSVLLFLAAVLVCVMALTACTKVATENTETAAKDNNSTAPSTEAAKTEPPAAAQSTEVAKTEPPAAATLAPDQKYTESPFLSGKGLPPVSERMPKQPKLTNEMQPEVKIEPGIYGGELRTVRTGAWDATLFILQNEPLLNSPGLTGEAVTGNVLESFDTQDQKTFTFKMREGLKWSDGEPVTVEDVRFAVEDVLFNKDLSPTGPPTWLKAASDASAAPLKFEKIDDFAFKISFEKPYGAFPMQLAVMGWKGYSDLLKPAHFLKQFHTKYTDLAKLEPLIKKKQFAKGEWVKLFNEMDVTNWESPNIQAIGFPVLYPFIMKAVEGDRIKWERNPYYYKVDTKGQQLPYMDTVRSDLVHDVEAAILKIMAGEVDHSYEYVSLPKVPLLKENEKKGNYIVYMNNLHRSAADIHLNLTFKDDNWRKVVRDLRFRKALNLAINKKEIADSVYYGFADPNPIQGTDMNIDEANKLLDEMGMKKGSDGFRVGPNGKTFVIPIEHGAQFTDINQLGELLVEQWKAIGIKTTVKALDPTLWNERNIANQLQATLIWSTPGPTMWPNQDWNPQFWAPLWFNWYNSQGKQGEEPPAEVKKFFKSISSFQELSLKATSDTKNEVVQSVADNLWYFIPLGNVKAPVAVNAKIGNFSDQGYGIAHNFGGEEWYFKK